MTRNKSKLRVPFDVDKTLISPIKNKVFDKAIYIIDPYDNIRRKHFIHTKHIKLLKDFKARGYHITVWSANGEDWANRIVVALELDKYVDETCEKFIKYVDDLEAKDIMGVRIYLDE